MQKLWKSVCNSENAKVRKLVWFLHNVTVRKLVWFLENATVVNMENAKVIKKCV